MKRTSLILGVMSGTSLDGLDMALCRFSESGNSYDFEILKTEFISYEEDLKKKLSAAHLLSSYEFINFHKSYGSYIGEKINEFITHQEKPDYIASHGHTIFHEPHNKLSFQIGDGAFISAKTGISVISDFRNLDTALGGQGAPLVPIGDKYLFENYDFCINLGGFANISYDSENKRIAFDICPLNFVLNHFSGKLGFDFDDAGLIGKQGKVDYGLLNELSNISYYQKDYPKSLAREDVEKDYFPIFEKFELSINDKIRTYYEHAAEQIVSSIENVSIKSVLLTGGGTYNEFLISLIKQKTKHKILIPDKTIIDFKEALIFAFLGYLRQLNRDNTLASVTGASLNSCGGNIYCCDK